MKTREKIRQEFELTDRQAAKAEHIQSDGYSHGKAGLYPDGDFSSDADWCYGVGARIQELEAELDIDDSSIFDLYSEAHGEGLAEFRKENTIATWSECDDVETWEDDNGVTHEAHSALVFISLQSGQYVMHYKGYEVRFMHISYKCPELGIYGARDERQIKRLINRELKKRAKG